MMPMIRARCPRRLKEEEFYQLGVDVHPIRLCAALGKLARMAFLLGQRPAVFPTVQKPRKVVPN